MDFVFHAETIPLEDTPATGVINELMEVFAGYGLPVVIVSDNRPQFSDKEIKGFLKQLGIQHAKASPRYPQLNGMV
jgi:transposase InsO family protein